MLCIDVDFGRVVGKIKPMHAINNMPTAPRNNATDLWGKMREAHIPYGRLHDTSGPFGGAHFVDVPNVFPDFDEIGGVGETLSIPANGIRYIEF